MEPLIELLALTKSPTSSSFQLTIQELHDVYEYWVSGPGLFLSVNQETVIIFIYSIDFHHL